MAESTCKAEKTLAVGSLLQCIRLTDSGHYWRGSRRRVMDKNAESGILKDTQTVSTT